MIKRLIVLAVLTCSSLFIDAALAAGQGLPVTADQYGDPLPKGAVQRLGSLRFWHDGHIGFTADSKKLASIVKEQGGYELRSSDIATGKTTTRPLPMKEGDDVFFSADRRYLVIHGRDFNARVLNLVSGTVRQLGTQLPASAISADGKLLLATRGRWGTIYEPFPIMLWSVSSGERLAVLHGHKTWVTVLAFLPDGKRFISVSDEYKRNSPLASVDGTICFWEASTGKLLRQLRHPGGIPNFSSVSPDGKLLYYCGSKDYQSHLWDLEADREIAGSQEDIDNRWQAALHPNVKDIPRFVKLLGKDNYIAAVSPDGKILASRRQMSTDDYATRLWDTATGSELRPLGGHQDAVLCLAYAPGGKSLISGGRDGRVIRWDAATGKELGSYLAQHPPGLPLDARQAVRAVAVSPHGRTIAAGSDRNTVYLWDLASGKKLHEFEAQSPLPDELRVGNLADGIRFLVFTEGGKRLIVGSSGAAPKHQEKPGEAAPEKLVADSDLFLFPSSGMVSTWDVASGKRIAKREREHENPVALSPKAGAAAWVTHKGSLFNWECELLQRRVDSGKVTWRLKGAENESFNHVEYSPDGKRLIVTSTISFVNPFGGGSSRPFCRLLDVTTGKEVIKVEKYQGRLFFSADGSFMASIASGKGVHLLDLATGKSTRPFQGHKASVTTCAFSPDNRYLATASVDHTILVWDLAVRK
jgi:WD40 repeat protein